MSDWENHLMSYIIQPEGSANYALSAAITSWDFSQGTECPAGSTWWGASSQAGAGSDDAWNRQYASDQERAIMQEDGSEKPTQICELTTIVTALKRDLDKDGPPPNGVWVGGNKHRIVRKEVDTGGNNEYSFIVMSLARPGEKGHIIVCSDSETKGKSIVVSAEYDKQANCTNPMAQTVAVAFAQWCKEQGVDQY